MIVTFKDRGTEDIFNGDNTRFNGDNTRAARQSCPESLWRIAARKLDQLDSATVIDDLRVPPGNRLETLYGDRKGQYSIRINAQFRICFAWSPQGPDEVEIVDYH